MSSLFATVSVALHKQIYPYLSDIGRTPQHDLIRAKMREVREKAGLSQRELSKKLGQQSTYVYKLEAGIIRRIDIVELSEYLEAMDMTLIDFLVTTL